MKEEIIEKKGALVAVLGLVATGVGACMSLGNLRFKKLGIKFSILGGCRDCWLCCMFYSLHISSGYNTRK